MIHPSYTELMEVINEGAEIDDEPLVTTQPLLCCTCYK